MFSFKEISKDKNSPFPLLIVNNFINKTICNRLKQSIISNKSFDDYVMNGRYRVNKGSHNFKKFVKKSKQIELIYNELNKYSFYFKITKLLENHFSNDPWKIKNKIKKFSKNNFGLQSGSRFTNEVSKKKLKIH